MSQQNTDVELSNIGISNEVFNDEVSDNDDEVFNDEDSDSSVEKYKGATQVYLGEDEDNERQPLTWNNPMESLMYLLSYVIGLGNVWNFPSLAAKYGGGTFLVAYMLMVIIIGFPIMFMELSLGQYSKSGPLDLYGNMAPIFRGLGFCMVTTISLLAISYNVIISWFIYYLFASFQSPLPWTTVASNRSSKILPAELYFKDKFLGYDSHINWYNFGDLRWQLVLCLIAAWSLVCFLYFIDRIGKIRAYFFVIAPSLALLTLMIFGATLEGAGSGINLYIKPNWNRFHEFQLWTDATVQVLYSLGIAFGGVSTIGSYNKFKNNCLKDALIVVILDSLTSIIAGIVVFSYLGFLAHELKEPCTQIFIENNGFEGPKLAFIGIPFAISKINYFTGCPQLLSALSSFMFLVLGFGSLYVEIEIVLNALDQIPILRGTKRSVFGVCIIGFLIGLIFCTPMGYNLVIEVFEEGLNSWNLFIFAFLEVILVGWVYGLDQFIRNLNTMELPIKHYMAIYLKIGIKFASPVVLTILIIVDFYHHGFHNEDDEPLHHGLGHHLRSSLSGDHNQEELIPLITEHFLTFASVIFLPIFAGWEIIKIYWKKSEDNKKLLKPTKDWTEIKHE